MSEHVQERLDQRKKEFKKGISSVDARRKRVDDSNQIRKQKREDKLAKKRCRSDIKSNKYKKYDKSHYNKLNLVYSNDPDDALEGLVYIRTLLTVKNPNLHSFVCSNFIDKVVEYLSHFYNDHPLHQKEAAWIMTNAISGSSEDSIHVLENTKLIQYSVTLLNSNDSDIRDQIIWCIGNIAGESSKYKNKILSNNGLLMIIRSLEFEWNYKKRDLVKLRNHVWSMSNLLRVKGEKDYPSFSLTSQCMPILSKIINTTSDNELLIDVAWCLSYILKSLDNSDMKKYLEFGVLTKHTMNLLRSNDIKIVVPFLRVCGNLISGSDDVTQKILDLDFLSHIPILVSKNDAIKKETCWILSNVTAGTNSQVKQFIKSNLVPIIYYMLLNDTYKVKKECMYIIANMVTKKHHNTIDYIVSCGCIKAICQFLTPDISIKMSNLILSTLTDILKSGKKHGKENKYVVLIEDADGLDKIELLQNHNNENIYNKSYNLIEKYFNNFNNSQSYNDTLFNYSDNSQTNDSLKEVFSF